MSSSSARRGQVHPLVALVAAAVFVLATSLATTTVADLPSGVHETDQSPAAPTLASVAGALRQRGALVPDLSGLDAVLPAGYRTNVTLAVGDDRVTRGPSPPPGADAASRPVPVRMAPGRVRPGRLTVVVWT